MEKSLEDFDLLPFEGYSFEKLDNVFDGPYLKIEGTVQELRMNVNGEILNLKFGLIKL